MYISSLVSVIVIVGVYFFLFGFILLQQVTSIMCHKLLRMQYCKYFKCHLVKLLNIKTHWNKILVVVKWKWIY